MVNTTAPAHDPMTGVSRLLTTYVAVVVATIAALAVLTLVAPDQATTDAWVHAAIVAVFAVLLLVRLRSARHGSRRARRAVGVVAVVLVAVNVVEATAPGLFPAWMRIEMVAIAAIMAAIGILTLTHRSSAGADET